MTFNGCRVLVSIALVWWLGCGSLHVAGAADRHGQAEAPAAVAAGAVALMGNALDAAALENIRRALSADDPIVRSVAARLAGATAQTPLADAIAAVWEREQEAGAAAEQARALLFIRGAAAAESIEKRLGSDKVAVVYAEWVARHTPERFAELLPKLAAAIAGHPTGLNSDAIMVLRTRPELAERTLRACLRAITPAAWRTLVDSLPLDQPRTGQDTVLLEALASENPQMRAETVWSLVVRIAEGRAVTPALLDAAQLVAPIERALENQSVTWEQLGREVIARRLGRKQTPDRSALLAAEAAKHLKDSRPLARLDDLPSSERQALKTALGDNYPQRPQSGPGVEPTARTGAAMRTIPPLWPGFLKSLLDAAGCRPGSSTPLGIASVSYRADGTVSSVTISPEPLPPGCFQAFSALLRLTIADVSYSPPPGSQELLILPFGSAAVECANRVDQNAGPPIRLSQDASIVPPRKIRDVRPIYAEELQRRRVQGTVVVESTIAATGCISGGKIVRGVEPSLDLAALSAVSSWEFTPTTVDGRKVPVTATVTVNFFLR